MIILDAFDRVFYVYAEKRFFVRCDCKPIYNKYLAILPVHSTFFLIPLKGLVQCECSASSARCI